MRAQLLHTFLLFLALAVNRPAATQPAGDFRFVNFGTKDGLEDKFFYMATQDKQGYMWFGTANGLYRYDGHRFKKFRSPLDKSGDAIGNVLQSIITDDEGNLWLGSYTSLQYYNPQKNIFWKPVIKEENAKRLNSDYIKNFSKGKYLWISTGKNAFYRFNRADSSFLSFAGNYPAGTNTQGIINVIEYGNRAFAVHAEGIYIFTINGRFEKTILHPAQDISYCFFDEKRKTIYLSTLNSGLLKLDMATEKITDAAPGNKSLKKNNLLCVIADGEDHIYMGGYPLHRLNTVTQEYINFFAGKQHDEYTLNSNKVGGLFFDKEHNLWICSYSGLSMMPWQNQQLRTIPLRDARTGWLIEPLGVYKEPDGHKILITSSNASGLICAEAATGQVSILENKWQQSPFKKRIISLIVAPDSSVYASDDENLLKYNSRTQSLSPVFLKDQNGQPLGAVARNICTPDGLIYIGSVQNGFYIWDYYKNQLTHYNKKDVLPDAQDNIITPCLVDSKQNIWFTSNDGLVERRKTDGNYYKHSNSPSAAASPLGATSYIAEDIQGHFWIATTSNGLYEMYREQGKEIWKNYTVNSGIGLPSDYNTKIKLNPADGMLWVNNTVGLLRFDPRQKRVVSVFDKQNGFPVEGSGYGFNLLSNNLLVQQLYGYASVIDLNTYKWNTTVPEISFNAVKVMNEEKLFEAGTTGKLTLNHNQNFLQIEFVALVFNNANRNQYAYKLEGVDKEWIYCGNANTVSYAALKHGTYHFKVKAANSDGLWGPEKTIKIIIRPPFYLTGWFITAALLSLGLLVYWWNRQKINSARKEEKLKAEFNQQISQMEMKALRAQMNPHFIFNSLNSIQKYILQNDHFAASQYLTRFSRLIRHILEQSNQNTILLGSELELLRLYIEMESLRFDNKFNYTITVQPGIHEETTEIPSMLIQPYIENAIWHGLLHKEEKGSLLVSFTKKEPAVLQVVIQDDGIGRQKAAELKSKQVLKKKSYGMKITEDRISIINRIQKINASCLVEDLLNEQGGVAGTRVTLLIPVKSLNE